MFRTKLKVEKDSIVNGVKWYRLKAPLLYDDFIVPVGFKTDLATIPKQLTWIFKPNGKYARASVLHDFLYDKKVVSRKEADIIFKEAMLKDGVSDLVADIFYVSVRLFGGRYYVVS